MNTKENNKVETRSKQNKKIKLITNPISHVTLVDNSKAMLDMLQMLTTLKGEVAIDTERASGIRYDGDKAYLVQLKRQNQIFIIDTIVFPDLKEINEIIKDTECILHAADQDLPCLTKTGIIPTKIFDTEKAARLLNYNKVSLGSMVEEKLNVKLEKLHSNDDWSVRPIPKKWIAYAALDVEYLIELKNKLIQELIQTEKIKYAEEEFTHCLQTTYEKYLQRQIEKNTLQHIFHYIPGCLTLKNRRQLEIVHQLYITRENLGKKLDIAPTMLLKNKALTQAAKIMPHSREEMMKLSLFKGKKTRAHKNKWWGAIARAYSCPEEKLVKFTRKENNAPFPNTSWKKNYPDIHEQLQKIKTLCEQLAKEKNLRIETLITSKDRHILAWNLPTHPTATQINNALQMCSLLKWQKNLLSQYLQEKFK